MAYLTVVFLFSTRHKDKHKRYLFGMIFSPHKCIYCEKLLEWSSAQLESAICVPAFGLAKLLQLLISGKYEVASSMLFDISSQEISWDVFMVQLKLGSRGLLFWRSRLAALARCSGLLSAGQGPSPSLSRRT